MLSLTVSTKGQVLLPAEVRHKLGIMAGSKLELEIHGNDIILKPVLKRAYSPEECMGLVKNIAGPVPVERINELLEDALVKDYKS